MAYYYIYLLCSTLILWSFFRSKRVKSHGPLPPSPGRAYPLIGHLTHMPRSNSFLTFTAWAKELGPLFHVNLAGQIVVVISSHKIAAELLDRRSAIYSDRPLNIVAGQLLTGGLIFVFQSQTERWKRMRRASHEALAASVLSKYHYMQETEGYLVAHQFLDKPDDWDDHLRRASNSLVLSVMYGLPPSLDSSDPNIKKVNAFVERSAGASEPGAFLVEYFTWMQYLPKWMCGWRTWAEDWFDKDSILFERLFQDVQERMSQGKQITSIASILVENKERFGMTDQEAAWCVATMYAAGGESTASQLAWIMMILVLYPEVQSKAQAEIDRGVGRDRLPTFQDIDQERLPYIHAIIREIMRWRGVLSLCIPHRVREDDHYEGFHIPKNAIVVPNIWGMNHDEAVWGPDADQFRPERHLDDRGQLKQPLPNTHEDSHVTFGFGRRLCVGRQFANNNMLIQLSSILWSCHLRVADDENGKKIVPNPNEFLHDQGLVLRPKLYRYTIEPRSEDANEIIRQTLEFRGQATSL